MGKIRVIIALMLAHLLTFAVITPAAAAVSRATNKVDMTVPADSIVRTETPLSMEAGEVVTISCTYSPRTADVDFGLLTPQKTFRYISGEDGLCRQTIQISQTGNYYFAVRNNSSGPVEVLGYVYY